LFRSAVWERRSRPRFESVATSLHQGLLPGLPGPGRSFAMNNRRFPPSWSVEEQLACFVVRDHNGQQPFAYVYFENEPRRRSATKLLSKDEAQRIAMDVAPAQQVQNGFAQCLTLRPNYSQQGDLSLPYRGSNSGRRSLIRWRSKREGAASVLDRRNDGHPKKANTASSFLQSAR
jgi:hypothetical protein